jgi:hypothetical protein
VDDNDPLDGVIVFDHQLCVVVWLCVCEDVSSEVEGEDVLECEGD